MKKNKRFSALLAAIILIISCLSFSALADTVSTSPDTDTEAASVSEHSGTSSESNYITFATVGTKGNDLATKIFYTGVACIALGVLGLIILIILYFKNRRYSKNHREGIFEEIEEAEFRNRAEYFPQDRFSPVSNFSEEIEVPANNDPISPVAVSVYTEELPYEDSTSDMDMQPEAAPTPIPPADMYDTAELLREILGKMED